MSAVVQTQGPVPVASKALASVRPPRRGRPALTVAIAALVVLVFGLYFVPWQQTVTGRGEILIFNPVDRPQTIESPIPARLVSWSVMEGDLVKEGQPIAVLEDIDSKFLDPEQQNRARGQRDRQAEARQNALARAQNLKAQEAQLRLSREANLQVARRRVQQSEARLKGAREAERAAREALNIARRVAVQSAKQRQLQAEDRVRQSRKALEAAINNETIVGIQLARITRLANEGIRSVRDREVAQNDMVRARTERERAELAVEVARKDATVGTLEQDRADIEVQRAEAAYEQARNAFTVAERDVENATFDVARLDADTLGGLSSLAASIEAAEENAAKSASDLLKTEIELSNITLRGGQQVVKAPRAGRIVRLNKVGPGQTVKAGDALATIAPTTAERTVELSISDHDAPLLAVGRPVRLQFAGFPAVQFGGQPGASVGTFGGRIRLIDPVDDGTGRYRVIVEADRQILAGGRRDDPWPNPERLRPGTEAFGWILLDTVPLGFELWRQFNGFPPRPPKAKDPKSPLDPGPVKLKSK